MATEGLSRHYQNEVKKFLKFFRSKLEIHLKGIESDFEDTRSDRLSMEDMYTQNEVVEVMDSLCLAIQSSVRTEFQASINMTALLLRQIFMEADEEELDIKLDTSVVEDRGLLEKVQRMKVDGEEESVARERKANKKITKMNEEQSELEKVVEKLKEENRVLLDKVKQSQMDCASALAKAEKRDTTVVDDGDMVEEMKRLKRKLKELEKQKSENAKHVADSRQFQQLKAMVAKKNDQLRELRNTLLKYEPDMDADDKVDQDSDDEFDSKL